MGLLREGGIRWGRQAHEIDELNGRVEQVLLRHRRGDKVPAANASRSGHPEIDRRPG